MADSGSSDSIRAGNEAYGPPPKPQKIPQLTLACSNPKGVAGVPLEKGVSHTEHVDLNRNLEAK
jgi:hypothetical protein